MLRAVRSSASADPVPEAAAQETGGELSVRHEGKSHKFSKRSRTSTFGLGKSSKNSGLSRKSSICLVAVETKENVAGNIRRRSPSFNMNVDNLFTGKCYMPRPVHISDNYQSSTWLPVPINEQTVIVPDTDDMAVINMSHEDQDFYHRELSREEVFRMFQRHGNTPGLCIVRDSTRVPGQYALTVWVEKSAVNYRVEFTVRNGQAQFLLSGRSVFGSLAEILLFLHHNPQFFPATPLAYIPRVPDKVKDKLYSNYFVGA